MPLFSGKEAGEIRSWIFKEGKNLLVHRIKGIEKYFISTDSRIAIYIYITPAEAKHALRVLGCISGAFKTQGESNT